uniref:Renin receptor-like C-terminal transmembrane spanning segment domain-containing protein n=1 Tax=Meloidogyne incognita TaxID=6306 RepID=A0A914KXC2_MELIC
MLLNLMFILLFIVSPFIGLNNAQEKDNLKKLEDFRQALNVNQFSSPGYPAMFGIVAGVSIVLVVAVTFIVVGLFSMEPSKDSIIYRMTNTRMKKD